MLLAISVCLLSLAGGGASPQRPNILFLIADDWGLHAEAYGTSWAGWMSDTDFEPEPMLIP